MRWTETWRIALEAVRTHRLRSLLTVLGIFIGIASVTLTVGLGQGAQQSVEARINSLGSNLLIVSPGSSTTSGVRGGLGSATTLTMADAKALADPEVAPDIAKVAPVSTSSKVLTVGTTTWTTSVVGTTPDWADVRARTLQQGRFFSTAELDSAANVMVLGASTAQELVISPAVVGTTVTVNGTPFTVIGVLASSGSSGSTNEDDQALIPYTTMQQTLGSSTPGTVSSIYLEAASGDRLSAAYQQAYNALLTRHDVTATTADFSISSQQSLVETATATTKTLTILLGGIAAISLLVGGIGVMNIMLVTVTERTREIGIRKAIGAGNGDIIAQFLLEAVMLCMLGGLLGVLLGSVTGLVRIGTFQPVVSPGSIVLAFSFAVAVGLIFGLYPANRAARLKPIDALRYE
jgi:putative ABC transport system permease protein